MRVRQQVEGHAIAEDGAVRSVIEIEPAKRLVVRFTAPNVLRDDHAGNGLQNLTRP